MNHPTNQNARGSALTTLIGGIVILLATLYLLVKLASSGYHGTVEETTDAATQTRIQPQGSIVEGDGVPVGERKGDKIFAKVCYQCHAVELATACGLDAENAREQAESILVNARREVGVVHGRGAGISGDC